MPAQLIVAPTEPPELRAIGITSSLPESYGADVLFSCPTGLVAVQRKTVLDLINSLTDGRLSSEFAKLSDADIPLVLIEGRPSWTADGLLMSRPFRKQAWWGLLLSIVAGQGFPIVQTDSLNETAEWLTVASTWFGKTEHRSLRTRPKPLDAWGEYSSMGSQLLQSFPGIGPDRADAIMAHFGGVPLRWTVEEKELRRVKGLGKETARRLIEALRSVSPAEVIQHGD
jgi:ERCC4-type nuclease